MKEICTLTDLPIEWCGCRVHVKADETAAGDPSWIQTGAPFTAQYSTPCPACGEWMDPGDYICRTNHGFTHVECSTPTTKRKDYLG